MIAPERESREVGTSFNSNTKQVPEVAHQDILQLLKDYRAFHTAYGGALPFDETDVVDASYGPAGLIETGQEYTKKQRLSLLRSYWYLERGLIKLKARHFELWMSLLVVYLGDPADPSRVDLWRRKQDQWVSARLFIERHDAAIPMLAKLVGLDLASRNEEPKLYSIAPKYLSPSEEQDIEHQYAEMYAVFNRLLHSGLKTEAAALQTADFFSERSDQPVPVDVVYRVIEFRSKNKVRECLEEGCETLAFSQNLCMKHYQQRRRKGLRKATRIA